MSKSKFDGLFIVKKKKGLADIVGYRTKPRQMYKRLGESEEAVDGGDYTGVKFPSSKEDIMPLFERSTGKWAFEGTQADVDRLVSKIKLRYPKSHPDYGKIIEKAYLADENDEFFHHAEWTETPFVMNGSSAILNGAKPKEEFLLRCSLGDRFTEDLSEDSNPLTAAGMRYQVLMSSSDNAAQKEKAMNEIEIAASLSGLKIERAKQISIVLGLVHSMKSEIDVDSVIPNLLTAIKKTSRDPGDRRIFEGKSYQEFYKELILDDNAALTKKVNIRLGVNTNMLRFKEGVFRLKGKAVGNAAYFSHLVEYFSDDENSEDYNTLIDAINA